MNDHIRLRYSFEQLNLNARLAIWFTMMNLISRSGRSKVNIIGW